jgi:hypothetical protein
MERELRSFGDRTPTLDPQRGGRQTSKSYFHPGLGMITSVQDLRLQLMTEFSHANKISILSCFLYPIFQRISYSTYLLLSG